MSWSRFDDLWSQRTVWEHVDLAARWHYLCLVQECSRAARYDGIMPLKTARRVSDVDAPDECHATLEAVSLIEMRGDALRVVNIDEYVPPPSVRNNAEATKVRMSRMRKHKIGDHSECLPEHCGKANNAVSPEPVTPVVTRNTGTGQDGQQPVVPTESDAPVTRNGPSFAAAVPKCPHGVDNGDQPDPWLKGRFACPECAQIAAALKPKSKEAS